MIILSSCATSKVAVLVDGGDVVREATDGNEHGDDAYDDSNCIDDNIADVCDDKDMAFNGNNTGG